MDLRGLAGHFYELAAKVLELFEEEEIVDILCEVRHLEHRGGRGDFFTQLECKRCLTDWCSWSRLSRREQLRSQIMPTTQEEL